MTIKWLLLLELQVLGSVNVKAIPKSLTCTIPGTILEAARDKEVDVLGMGVSGFRCCDVLLVDVVKTRPATSCTADSTAMSPHLFLQPEKAW